MKKITTIFLWLFLLLSCIAEAQDPPQYGTPFAGVPDPRDVNMYQVHTRIFSAAGNFQGVISRLPQIQALGINTIYLDAALSDGYGLEGVWFSLLYQRF